MNFYTWLNTFFFSMAPLLGWSRFSYEGSGTSCTVEFFENDGYETYIWSSSVFCYLIPVLLMIACKIRYSNIDEDKKLLASGIHVFNQFKLILVLLNCCFKSVLYCFFFIKDPNHVHATLVHFMLDAVHSRIFVANFCRQTHRFSQFHWHILVAS